MKTFNDLTAEESNSLAVGDDVRTVWIRSGDFRAFVADGATPLGSYPEFLILSITRNEPRDITTTGTVVSEDGKSFSILVKHLSAKPVTVEEAQVRMSPGVAIEVALSLLQNVATALPGVVREKFDEQAELKAILTGDAA